MAVITSHKTGRSATNSLPMVRPTATVAVNSNQDSIKRDPTGPINEVINENRANNLSEKLTVFVDGGKGSSASRKSKSYRGRTVSSGSYASTMSNKEMCRICHYRIDDEGSDVLIYPCACTFSSGGVHESCVNTWAWRKRSNVCEICRRRYDARYVPYIKQPFIHWKFVPQYTRRRTFIAIIVLTFLLAITSITSYLLANTLLKDHDIKNSLHIVWPLVAVVSISGMGTICFLAWFIIFFCETVKEYKEESSKHKEQVSVPPVTVQQV